jgi:hypothetical protein
VRRSARATRFRLPSRRVRDAHPREPLKTTSSSSSSGEACGREAVKGHSATVRARAKRDCATAAEKGATAERARNERRSIGVIIAQVAGNVDRSWQGFTLTHE